METGAKLSIIGTIFFYGGVVLGIIAIIFMVYVTVKQHTRNAVKESVKADYGKVKDKASGTVAKLKAWRRERLQKKLDKLNG
jgi:ribosomal protein S6